MRAKAAACLAVVPLLVVDCSAQTSLRDTATKLLTESNWFKVERTENVPSGKYCYSPLRQLKDAKEADGELFEAPLAGGTTPFNASFLFGVVTATPINVTQEVRFGPMPAECQPILQQLIAQSRAFGRQFWLYDVAVTADARAAGIPATGGPVVVANKELVAVTGVAQRGDLADAEFVWMWTRNALGDKFRDVFAGTNKWIPAVARFRRYDDGWRILSVACGSTAPSGSRGSAFPGCEVKVTEPLPTAMAFMAKTPGR